MKAANKNSRPLKKNRNSFWLPALLILFTLVTSFVILKQQKPTLYIIGDSTVKNGDGTGKGSLWGWGSFIANYFDTTKIRVQNDAIGGRSSRTFITEGRWEKVLQTLKKGDYVIMQFGHNDSGPLDDTARARGTIRGTGTESKEIYNPITKKQEVVYSYGWYMRKYIDEAKAKGATAIVCSPIPRNDWNGNKLKRGNEDYGKWAREVAQSQGAYFIDLNNLIADKYDAMGTAKAAAFFPGDHTHTNEAGALMNAGIVINGIKELKGVDLKKYLK
jgi:rhamnogalacturonan acetylesterase